MDGLVSADSSFVEQEKHGMNQRDAIIDAGRKRARPIIMTTIAMAAGMMPAAMASGEGGEFRAPMAIAVIGGLLVSTVLSLILIPSLYTLMDDLSRVTGRVFGRLMKPNRPDDAGEPPAPHHHPPAPSLAPDLDMAPSWKRVTEFGGRKNADKGDGGGGSTLQPAAE